MTSFSAEQAYEQPQPRSSWRNNYSNCNWRRSINTTGRRHKRRHRTAGPTKPIWPTLIQQEVDRRFGNRRQRRIKDAHFPLLKELADFDFTLPAPTQPAEGAGTGARSLSGAG